MLTFHLPFIIAAMIVGGTALLAMELVARVAAVALAAPSRAVTQYFVVASMPGMVPVPASAPRARVPPDPRIEDGVGDTGARGATRIIAGDGPAPAGYRRC